MVHRRSKYDRWRENADRFVLAQGRLKTHVGPCRIHIIIRATARLDLDNAIKPLLDYLVHHKIIENDDKSIVRSIYAEWGDVSGARIEIAPIQQTDAWVQRRGLAKRESAE